MKLFTLYVLWLNFVYLVQSNMNCSMNYNINYIRNMGLRIFLNKHKFFKNMIKNVKNKSHILYTNTITVVGKNFAKYDALTDDEKAIIETIISLCN